MALVNIYEQYDTSDAPRRLTSKEIEFIVQSIPLAPAADRESAELSRRQIMDSFRSILEAEVMCPSAVRDIADEVRQAHHWAVITPGTPVGFFAGESVGAAATQTTLNTFHKSGGHGSVSFTITSLKDIITATKNPKLQRCLIHFENKLMSYEQVLDSRSYIVGSVISDFVQGYFILSNTPENRKAPVPKSQVGQWWYDYTQLLLRKPIPTTPRFMRLVLNIKEMYKHRVTTRDIALALEKEGVEKDGSKGGKKEETITVLYGPSSSGVIDIYQTEKGKQKYQSKVKGLSDDLIPQSYYETIILPELSNIRVKGIPGLRNLIPVVVPIWSSAQAELRLTASDIPAERAAFAAQQDNLWFLFFNEGFMRMNGLERGNLIYLCRMAGITVHEEGETRLLISLPTNSEYRYRSEREERCLKRDGQYYGLANDVKSTPNGYRQLLSKDNLEQVSPDAYRYTLAKEKKPEIIPRDRIEIINGFYYRLLTKNEVIVQGKQSFVLLPSTIKVKELGPNEFMMASLDGERALHQDKLQAKQEEIRQLSLTLSPEDKEQLLRQPIVPDPSPLLQAAEMHIAQVDGSNLKELLAFPGIDGQRTTCDNIHVLAETLGIEATRAFIIRAITSTIGSGSQVHPANVALIAEFITSRGYPRGATFSGISRQTPGHLSLATLQKAGVVFTKSALQGKEEDIRGVSASIATGSRIVLGDGAFSIGQDVDMGGVIKSVVNDDLFRIYQEEDDGRQTTFSRSDIEAEIGAADYIDNTILLYNEEDKEQNLESVFRTGAVQDVTKRGTIAKSSPSPIETGNEVIYGNVLSAPSVPVVETEPEPDLGQVTSRFTFYQSVSSFVVEYDRLGLDEDHPLFRTVPRPEQSAAPLSQFSDTSYLADVQAAILQQSKQ